MARRKAPSIILAVAVLAGAGAAHAETPAEAGEALYAQNCAACHGDNLRNTSGGITFDLQTLTPQEHDRFVRSVLNGKNQMPPWKGVLADDQIEAIWAYIMANGG